MNVIDDSELEHDVVQKPVPAFWHHALACQIELETAAFRHCEERSDETIRRVIQDGAESAYAALAVRSQ